jgi:hypothetical protein
MGRAQQLHPGITEPLLKWLVTPAALTHEEQIELRRSCAPDNVRNQLRGKIRPYLTRRQQIFREQQHVRGAPSGNLAPQCREFGIEWRGHLENPNHGG